MYGKSSHVWGVFPYVAMGGDPIKHESAKTESVKK
jgi:hypothetical protein